MPNEAAAYSAFAILHTVFVHSNLKRLPLLASPRCHWVLLKVVTSLWQLLGTIFKTPAGVWYFLLLIAVFIYLYDLKSLRTQRKIINCIP